jgi:hypothetical protein
MAESLQNAFNSKAYRRALVISALALNAAIMPDSAEALPSVLRNEQIITTEAYLTRPEQFTPFDTTSENAIKILSPLTLPEVWANLGAPQTVIESLSRQSSEVQEKLTARTAEIFSNRDFLTVLDQISGSKAKNIDKLLTGIANVPAEMNLITLAYTKVPPDQNKDVWQEFQSRAEPAFYRHLAANHADELKAAGFCDYALSCLARGLSPTTEDGMPYNVDVDHVVERAGGGKMSTEKSVDPVTGGPATYPINHIGNLCLIMKSWHHTKNDLNGAQNIGATPVGETRMLCMAVPPLEKRAALLSAELVQPYLPPSGRDSIYFTQGTSHLLTREMEDMAQDISVTPALGQKLFDNAFKPDFDHTVNVWARVTDHIEKMNAAGDLRYQEAKDLQESCDNFLTPLITAAQKVHVPPDNLEKLAKISDRMQTVIASLNAQQGAPSAAKPPQGQKAKGSPHGHA